MRTVHSENMAMEPVVEKLGYFQKRIDELTERVTALEQGTGPMIMAAPLKSYDPDESRITGPDELPWTMAGGGTTFLPRVAAVCFLLVAALILRTFTDIGAMGQVTGTWAGIGYAALLMAAGGVLYAKGVRIALVFPMVGAFLLLMIVLETHTRFEVISTPVAYLVLLAGEFAIVGIGLRYRDSALIYLGTIGFTVAGFSIDFPANSFVFAGMLLLTATASSYLAEYRGIATASRWWILFLSLLFWIFWSFKLSVPFIRGEIPQEELASGSFFPVLAIFFFFHLTMTFWRILTLNEPLGFYCGVIPSINVLVTYFAGQMVAEPWLGSLTGFGWALTAAAMPHFVGAEWLAKRGRDGAPGVNAFAAAGSILIVLGLPAALGTLAALPWLSILSGVLTVFSGKWKSGGVRLTSYILQAYVMLTIAARFPVQGDELTASIIAAATIMVTAFTQYRWCRDHEPYRIDSAWFAWLDRRDLGAIVLFLAGLIGSFGFLRAGLVFAIRTWNAAEPFFCCGQSVIINIGVVLLLIVSLRSRNREVLTVALSVLFFGAVKVFLFDLLKTSGLPLVVSVFAFGIAALAASLVLARWPSVSGNPGKLQAE